MRNKAPDGRVLSTGGTTIGYEKVNKDGKLLLVTFARCSENDVFNKKKSRLICSGRFRKGKYVELKHDGKDIYETLIKAAITHEETIQAEKARLGIKTRA
jgi:hypothetical protein